MSAAADARDLALFDFDGTLTTCDTPSRFVRENVSPSIRRFVEERLAASNLLWEGL
ncbi:hypothetical protein [Coralloluteibacterium stylophorae]|uniref:Uncharacterized protein n=1 Tax=Coralloluteibacterium stylophorae TaxID=1776034 RepID=A0AAP2G050_9GAMM|nr:hypothetical protein [Coralloluteibacterium stylophorae]MBS7458732.1 hypothetical protein [Coralloluteibacterium stylophorae]